MSDTFKRMIQKVGTGVPTIPVSTDHRNGDWLDTDIYEGELYLDEATSILYTRVGSTILKAGNASDNFANADLTFTGNRVHDLAGYLASLMNGALFVELGITTDETVYGKTLIADNGSGLGLEVRGAVRLIYQLDNNSTHTISDGENVFIADPGVNDVDLPPVSPDNISRVIIIKNRTGSSLNVNPDGTEEIDGVAGAYSLADNATIKLIGVGTDWVSI